MKYAVTYNKFLETAGRVALVTDTFLGVPRIEGNVLVIQSPFNSDILLMSTSFLTVEPFIEPASPIIGV